MVAVSSSQIHMSGNDADMIDAIINAYENPDVDDETANVDSDDDFLAWWDREGRAIDDFQRNFMRTQSESEGAAPSSTCAAGSALFEQSSLSPFSSLGGDSAPHTPLFHSAGGTSVQCSPTASLHSTFLTENLSAMRSAGLRNNGESSAWPCVGCQDVMRSLRMLVNVQPNRSLTVRLPWHA